MRLAIWQKIFWVFFLLLLTTGFQIYPNIKSWKISRTSAAAAKLFVTYPNGSRVLKNDLPGGDPLAGAGASLSVDTLISSIFDDYNDIDAAFVILVNDLDGDFAAESTDRRITVVDGPPNGTHQGHHETDVDDDRVPVGCTVTISDEIYDSAKRYVDVVTHEIGHCLGLDHPQDTTHARMSYFRNTDKSARLRIDDKMGLVYLFPTDPSYNDEESTWGFSCTEK